MNCRNMILALTVILRAQSEQSEKINQRNVKAATKKNIKYFTLTELNLVVIRINHLNKSTLNATKGRS